MSVNQDTVRRIARLARISVNEDEVLVFEAELNSILKWIEMLNEVDTSGVEPLTSAVETQLHWREDTVTDGGYPDQIVANAPASDDGFFMVPKVVE